LTDYIGAAVELYSYDAFGNALGFDPSNALTEFLYSGEQFDSKIGQQYLRQRYYDPSTGRFNRLDPFFGNLNDPLSLHKYLYTHGDPINGIDPTGCWTLAGFVGAIGARLGISGSSISAILLTFDKATTVIDIVQIATQIMLTGTVNPMQLFGVMIDILPGSKFFKKIGLTIKPALNAGLNCVGKLTKSAEGLTGLWKSIVKYPGPNIVLNVTGKTASEIAQHNRLVERIGEIGAGIIAGKLGFVPVVFTPLKHGIDGIFKKGDKWIIVEAKGGVSELGTTVWKEGQMSKTWIAASIEELRESGQEDLADKLLDAIEAGNIFGLVTKTPLIRNGDDLAEATIGEPDYIMKAWDQIGLDIF
jgi:RHS repeat-associated protein